MPRSINRPSLAKARCIMLCLMADFSSAFRAAQDGGIPMAAMPVNQVSVRLLRIEERPASAPSISVVY